MRNKLINSQLSNWHTYQMYLRELLTLAENVFEFDNMPTHIDTAYINKTMLRKGSIAFFIDEYMGLLALPYNNIGKLDIYGHPTSIRVFSQNGYQKILKPNEFVIMYDNNGQYPLYLDVCQFAERIALDTRTSDINIAQQKTPRIWKCRTGQETSLKALINNVDGLENTIATYNDLNLDDITIILEPSPFVADKIDAHKEKNLEEYYKLIGIANVGNPKKERLIQDELEAFQGSTIATRYSRFEPRKRALNKINKLFIPILKEMFPDEDYKEITVRYYDGEPTSNKKEIKQKEEEIKNV